MTKNMYKKLCIILTLFVSINGTYGQQNNAPIQFLKGNYFTDNNVANSTFTKATLTNSLYNSQYFVLIQFTQLPNKNTQLQMAAAGIVLYNYLPGNAYTAVIQSSFNFLLAKQFYINAISPIPVFYKLDKNIEYTNFKKEEEQLIAVHYFSVINKQIITQALLQAGAIIVQTKIETNDVLFIQPNTKILAAIAALPFVTYVQVQNIKDKALNYATRGAHGVSALNATGGKNLNGKGVTIGVGDNSDIDTHIDFTNRLINRSPWVPAAHGTHVAGTAAGAGILNAKNRGMAAKATIVNQYFSDIITNALTYKADYNMVLSNNSYYSVDPGCIGEGKYDVLSNYVDKQLVNNNQLLHVIAAGNDGSLTCSPYPASFGTVKSGWQSAKNVLTVGAIDAANYGIAYFSSRGPLLDGRLKPEITANGWGLLSTINNNGYGFNYGTSMSTPVVTGSLALMYERYRQTHAGANPTAALIKALACNTAEDLGNIGPDFTYGFGMLNVRRAVAAMDANQYFAGSVSQGNTNSHTIIVPANTKSVKVLLYWADVEATANAAIALVNDADLSVITPGGSILRPWVLNANASNVNEGATKGIDHINNIEQVTIDNPTAGNYTLQVNGFNIPSGTQNYVLVYDMQTPGVFVEYPYGGETLVPGETETIRWTAYGNETNNFLVEFSDNNGTSWSTINNDVPSTSRSITWVVPSINTNTALIRVSRKGTALTGQSTNTFMLLPQPIPTATNVCEGAVQFTWANVQGATTYDVYQLDGDSMKIIANTAANNYLITGLDKTKKYWFGVGCKNGAVSGRRCVSIAVSPNNGPCTLSTFNNDVKVESIIEPITARQLFANAANALKPVKVLIKNLGNTAVTGPFNVSYNYNGTIVTETVNTTIAAGANFTYTFGTLYTIIPTGFTYNFKSWVTVNADANHANDTAYKVVKYINNDAITALPFIENFDAMPATTVTQNEWAVGNNKYLDFFSATTFGRARTFVNTGFALSGANALTLDQSPYSETKITDSIILNYNLTPFSSSQLRFDFNYKNHGQSVAPNNKIWIRGSENDNWIEAYNLFDNQAELSFWKKGIININDVFKNANPIQNISPTFQIKIGQQGNTSANSANAIVDIDDGYTFDDLTISEAINDVAINSITSPSKAGCALTATNAISIAIKNYNNATLNNIRVSYRINGGSIVTENITSIAPNQLLNYSFIQTANLAAYIDYSIDVWVKYNTDNYAANDSIIGYQVHNSPVINNYPYYENFETNNGNFYAKGTNNTWQYGTPVGTLINKAANGTKAWVTNLSGNYADNETSYLISPCFDISGLSKPVLSFSHIFDVELDYDYTWVEYAIDGGIWQKLGTTNVGTNWYDNNLMNWSISNKKWHVASIDLPAINGTIKFRFILSSDGGVSMEGVGIDDVRVHEKSAIAVFPQISNSITKTVTGNSWVMFDTTIAGTAYNAAAINANGQNLGNVTVTYFPNQSDTNQFSNSQYYLGRNFVLTASIAPTALVSIRLYFTHDEAAAIMNATNCVACTILSDAYELGVTKYSGKSTDENGYLQDDQFGQFQFITPTNTLIVPHANGYYAEFLVNSFSECWLSKGLIKPDNTAKCSGSDIVFTALANTNATTYQWQINTGTGYTNIANGTYFANATTNTLTITNLPTSFAGNTCRCLVNGIPTAENTIQFNNVWNGNASTNWFDIANWGCASLPDSNTDVIIPGGLNNYPTVQANTTIKSIKIAPTATVNVATGVQIFINGKQ